MDTTTTKSRRRRKGDNSNGVPQTTSQDEGGEDYYSDSGDEKGHDEKMYKSACSMGRFFLNPCLCLVLAGQQCFRRIGPLISFFRQRTRQQISGQKRPYRKWDDTDKALLAGITISLLVCCYCFSITADNSAMFRRRPRDGSTRPFTDADVDHVPLLIPSLDSSIQKSVDMGGWMNVQRFYKPTQTIDVGQPERGNLFFIGAFGKSREVQPNDEEAAEIHWEATHVDKKRMATYNQYAEDIEDSQDDCRRVNWKMDYHPTCGDIHGIDLSRDYDSDRAGLGDDQIFDSFYISHGYYRDVWVVNQLGLGHDAKTVLKMGRWKHCDFGISDLQLELRDALVMERLTASPRIIDIYSFCGTSVQVEALPHEIEEVIVPGEGYIKQSELHDEEDVQPRNDYGASEKLELALAMAESLADLHGFKDGLIIHDDVQLCQWLRNWDGELKLGDFNRAEIPDFNERKQEYCTYRNGQGFGNYRSPEEYLLNGDLNEKIDVWSFGNNIYALLTGLWVFYENEDDAVVQRKVRKGDKAYIDPRYKERSYAEKVLVEVMEKCWAFKPKDRIDIFEVVRVLREAVHTNKNLIGDYK